MSLDPKPIHALDLTGLSLLTPNRKETFELAGLTDDTRNCDDVAEYLEGRYPDLKDGVLVIHTKNNGEISE